MFLLVYRIKDRFRLFKDRFRLWFGFRGLRGSEVVEKVFKILTKNVTMEVFFPTTEEPIGAFALIADDSDDHRTRRGYMRYLSFRIITLGSQQFALGLGTAWGSYPARPYENDIMILKVPQAIKDVEICKWLEETVPSNRIFRSSVILGMELGELRFPGTAWWWLSEKLLVKDFFRIEKKMSELMVTRQGKYNKKIVGAIARLVFIRLNEWEDHETYEKATRKI